MSNLIFIENLYDSWERFLLAYNNNNPYGMAHEFLYTQEYRHPHREKWYFITRMRRLRDTSYSLEIWEQLRDLVPPREDPMGYLLIDYD